MNPHLMCWNLFCSGRVGFSAPKEFHPEFLGAGSPPIAFLFSSPFEAYLIPIMINLINLRRDG